MQITKPIVSPDLQSYAAPVTLVTADGLQAGSPDAEVFYELPLMAKLRSGLRWLLDIDDGAGGVTCMVCVLLVFGTLFVRLVELDKALDSQSLSCVAIDRTTLQMECKFK